MSKGTHKNAHKTTQKTVLITGCSSGIGYACAHGLHRRGWRVFATARKEQDLERLQTEGLETLYLELDDTASIHAAVAEVLARTGGTLDALFNNAAFGQPGALEDLPRAALRAQFETNLFGTHELTNQIIPIMRRQGHGRIVYNSSILGYTAYPMRGAYTASKYALEGMADTLRLELRGSGIHIVLIEPGPITSRFRTNAIAAFQRHIPYQNSIHKAIYEGYLHQEKDGGSLVGHFNLPPEAVLEKLVHALEKRRPSPRYPVTVPSHLFAWLNRLLHTKTIDALLSYVARKEVERSGH